MARCAGGMIIGILIGALFSGFVIWVVGKLGINLGGGLLGALIHLVAAVVLRNYLSLLTPPAGKGRGAPCGRGAAHVGRLGVRHRLDTGTRVQKRREENALSTAPAPKSGAGSAWRIGWASWVRVTRRARCAVLPRVWSSGPWWPGFAVPRFGSMLDRDERRYFVHGGASPRW